MKQYPCFLFVLTTVGGTVGGTAHPKPADSVLDSDIDRRFPACSFVVDVTKPPYNAKGDGRSDSAAALQQAINDVTGTHKILYFPNGVYLISKPLVWTNVNSNGSRAYGFNWVQGQNPTKTIIRLRDGVLTDSNQPKAMLWCGGFGSADWFHHYIQDVTFDIGIGNPGAIGLQFYSNNAGAVRNCRILSGDGQGAVGLDLAHRDMNGPLLVRRLFVKGFRVGVATGHAVNSQTLEKIELEGQSEYGFDNFGQSIAVRQLTSRNKVPAVRSYGVLTLLDSTLVGQGGDAGKMPAVVNYNGGRLHLRDVQTSGYARAVGDVATPDHSAAFRLQGEDKPGSLGPNIKEYFSQAPTSPFNGPAQSLHLPIEETPDHIASDDPSQWAVVDSFGADPTGTRDSAGAIQKAIDSGADTIFFPGFYAVQKKITVRGKARRLLGTGGWIDYKSQSKPDFIIADGEPGVVSIEHFAPIMGGVQINTSRSVVLRSVETHRIDYRGTGKLFLEDVTTSALKIGNRQQLWARQLNIENEGTHLSNSGGSAWVFGYKTERGGTLLATLRGGKSEVFGTFSYTTTAGKLAPMFITHDASAFAFFNEICFNGDPFTVLIRETRNKVVREVRRGAGHSMPYVGSPGP